jgi:hypothetical protein
MRLLGLLMVLLSLVAALTLQRTDGTTLDLGDEPMEVDLSNVVMPQREGSYEYAPKDISSKAHIQSQAIWMVCHSSKRKTAD